ncbi:hypothetical protein [Holospora curviuscula]|uniref:hypothetical protein n=1 Tax=Holospora curviuscula TaxID=1082868 RepID=UPI00101ADA88|nr:hypothetical protein [Holospora curviuscula]
MTTLSKAFKSWKRILNDLNRLNHKGGIQALMDKPRAILRMKRGKEQIFSIGIDGESEREFTRF